MAELQPIIVFHGCHFVRHIGICNPNCVKLLQDMSGSIPSNLKETTSHLKPFPWRSQTRLTHAHTHTHTQTHTQTHTTIAIGEMQCLASKNDSFFQMDKNRMAVVKYGHRKTFHHKVVSSLYIYGTATGRHTGFIDLAKLKPLESRKYFRCTQIQISDYFPIGSY